MGITDEAYAQAIIASKNIVTSPQAGSITVSTTTTGALHYPNNVPNRELRMKSEDLDHEAAKASLDILKDMWLVRWQDKWVSKDQLVEDDFWRIAFVRLENVGKLERHVLADNLQYVYKVIE